MFYIQECRDIIESLNTEILEKPWTSTKVTLFHGNVPLSEKLQLQNGFNMVSIWNNIYLQEHQMPVNLNSACLF